MEKKHVHVVIKTEYLLGREVDSVFIQEDDAKKQVAKLMSDSTLQITYTEYGYKKEAVIGLDKEGNLEKGDSVYVVMFVDKAMGANVVWGLYVNKDEAEKVKKWIMKPEYSTNKETMEYATVTECMLQ